MKDIVIFGSGGFAREVLHLINDINKKQLAWNVLGFIDDNKENHGKIINDLTVLGGREWIKNVEQEINIALGIGNPKIKKMIVEDLKTYHKVHFPNLIHPSVNFSKYNQFGEGNIICEGNILTCNIKISSFSTINLNCTIGHDVVFEDYVTVLPNASISGNVILKECVDFGTNATIIQGLTVGEYSIIGAGAVVVKNIPANCTAVGMPAKPIKYHND